jgi:hypothetical protein
MLADSGPTGARVTDSLGKMRSLRALSFAFACSLPLLGVTFASCATGTGSNTATGSGGEGGGLFQSGGGGSATTATISPDAACAKDSKTAILVPVNMFLVFDKSGSMIDGGKWAAAKNALKAFFADPKVAGLRVAIRFFPDTTCDAPECDIDACEEPQVDIGKLTLASAPEDTQEDLLLKAIDGAYPVGGTPMWAALGGAEQAASVHLSHNPSHKAAVVLVTDGEPNGCETNIDEIAGLAAQAYKTFLVTTYVIGLDGANKEQLDKIAAAGETESAFFLTDGDVEGALLKAFYAIQGRALACQFKLPDEEAVDPTLVNVFYQPKDASEKELVGSVPGPEDCKGDKGDLEAWYYDDPYDPKSILLCPASCERVAADPDGKLSVVFGCATEPAK